MSPYPKKHLTVGGDDPFLPNLLEAINYSDEISIAVAFIKLTGIRLIQEALVDAIERGASVRILTGDYLGITDPKALRYFMLLQEFGAEVKVFESGGVSSFHMKAYLFTRLVEGSVEEGCAFIGSSNISRAALESGIEWNVKIDMAENMHRFQTITHEYDAIYNDERCRLLTHQWIDDYVRRVPSPQLIVNIEPGATEHETPPVANEVQKDALEALSRTREQGYCRGLVVMATGLGKTWLAAFDSQQMNAKRVLFVAHREEILNQAEATFVRIRPDAKVGRYAGRNRDLNVDMLFASIQTLGRDQHLEMFSADYFDYVIVDEFHHAAARTYQKLLSHFVPRFLLGLTATPERTDQSDILSLCDDNLVFNRDLFYGIESNLLCPFHYFGVADVVNYKEISWRNGKFDPEELVNQLATQARAKHNLKHWQDHHQDCTLAFCVSKRHADFMADFFNRNGVRSASVHSDSGIPRNEALRQLESGELEVIFSVDLFNEGVDLPALDTVLMLRPTDSKIIFLQQLGRGLRNSPTTGKDKLIVLDFIGNHISYFRKPEALFKIGITNSERKEFIQKIKDQALTLPKGCFVNFNLESIDFMTSLVHGRIDRQLDIYRGLSQSYGRRPLLAEFYRADGAVDTVRRKYGQWFDLVKAEGSLTENEDMCLSEYGGFFQELEKTRLNKSYKLVLIEAFIELEGFSKPPSTLALALKSYDVLRRRRELLVELPEEYRHGDVLPSEIIEGWHEYWNDNPINAWVRDDRVESATYFYVIDEKFCCGFMVEESLLDEFLVMTQEVVNYRFLKHEARLVDTDASKLADVIPIAEADMQEIPYFSDLRIACGHFRTSLHDTENIEFQCLPLSYGVLDPARHFIARASGDSMDGGLRPIKNGDYLLLELITPNSAGSNNGKIIAIERQDTTGDDQYLLRNVNKLDSGEYELIAQNPEYPAIMATEDMTTFARLKQVVIVADLYTPEKH